MLALQLSPTRGSSYEGPPVNRLTRRHLQHGQVSSMGAMWCLVVPGRNALAPIALAAGATSLRLDPSGQPATALRQPSDGGPQPRWSGTPGPQAPPAGFIKR